MAAALAFIFEVVVETAVFVAEALVWTVEAIVTAVYTAAEVVTSFVIEWTSTAIEYLVEIGQIVAGSVESAADWIITQYTTLIEPTVIDVQQFLGAAWSTIEGLAQMVYLRELLMIHNILQTISLDYRTLVAKLFKAFEGWLGGSVAAIAQGAAYLEFAHATGMMAGAISGQPFMISELRWVKTSADWMEEKAELLKSYQRDPARMVADFNTAYVEPMVNQTAENQTELFKHLVTAHEKLVEADSYIKNVEGAMDNWVAKMPEQWRDDIGTEAIRIRDELEAWRGETFWPEILRIGSDIATLNAARDAIKARIDVPGLLAEESLRPDAPQRERQLEAWDSVIGEAIARQWERVREERGT